MSRLQLWRLITATIVLETADIDWRKWHGIRFEQTVAVYRADPATVIAAYQADIDRLMTEEGQTADVVSLGAIIQMLHCDRNFYLNIPRTSFSPRSWAV